MIFRRLLTIAAVSLALLAACTLSAQARGGHGFSGHGFEGHGFEDRELGRQFAGGRRHGNDSYIKAASEEREKLLDTKLKSICRGC
jgi:hypothetical protein